MQTVKRSALVVILLLALIGCGKQAIIVDTTGLPPEQVALIEWKVKYAVAIDWYNWELQSLDTNLAALPRDDAQKIYAQAKPFMNATKAAIDAFKTAAYAQSPDPLEQQKAYEAFLRSKAKLLALLAELLAK